jgi:phosphatidylglycerophosphate synthase
MYCSLHGCRQGLTEDLSAVGHKVLRAEKFVPKFGEHMARRLSIEELRRICQPNRGRSWGESFTRKFSIYITWLFIRLPISANQITLFAILLAFLSMLIIIVSSNFSLWIVALIIYFFSLSLDYVDGEVARYHGTSSLSGLLFDRLAGWINPCLLILGIMYQSYFLTGSLLSISLGILAIMSILVPRLAISSMYQTAVEAMIKSSNVAGTVILTKSSGYTTLDQLSGKDSILKQMAWFLLGDGMILFLLGCFSFEYLAQNEVFSLITQLIEMLPHHPGFFLNLFLFYYGVLWLLAGVIYSIRIVRNSQTEGLHNHLLSFCKQDDGEEDLNEQYGNP